MFNIDEICGEINKMDPFTFANKIAEKGGKVMAGLAELIGDPEDASTLFTSLVLGTVISDGKLDEKEFGLIKPLIEDVVEEEITYEEAVLFVGAFKSEKTEFKRLTESLSVLFNAMSDEFKTDIVTLILLVCATDGKITKRERNWLDKIVG